MDSKAVNSRSDELSGSLECFVIFSKIDITATGNYSDVSQQNWDSLITVISMRAQPVLLQEPIKVDALEKYGASYLTGEGYMFKFSSEHEGIYSSYDHVNGVTNPFQLLIEMIEGITISDTLLTFNGDTPNIEILALQNNT